MPAPSPVKMLVVAAACSGLVLAPGPGAPDADARDGHGCRSAIVAAKESSRVEALVDRIRASAGRVPLRSSRSLSVHARHHSVIMGTRHVLAHERRFSWAPADGRAAQNLARAQNPRRAVVAMMRSAPHRRALLDRRFRFVGVGAARDCAGNLLVTVNLSTRR